MVGLGGRLSSTVVPVCGHEPASKARLHLGDTRPNAFPAFGPRRQPGLLVWNLICHLLLRIKTTGGRVRVTKFLVRHKVNGQVRRGIPDVLLLHGQLYPSFLPNELRDLKAPPRFRPAHCKRPYKDRFNQRSTWRLVLHTAADSDGFTRWKCPFCAGLLRSRKFPKTMRRSRSGPSVDVSEQTTECCSGSLSAPPVEPPLTRGIPFRNHGLENIDEPASDRRVCQRGAEGLLRRSVAWVLQSLRSHEDPGNARIHDRGLQLGPGERRKSPTGALSGAWGRGPSPRMGRPARPRNHTGLRVSHQRAV